MDKKEMEDDSHNGREIVDDWEVNTSTLLIDTHKRQDAAPAEPEPATRATSMASSSSTTTTTTADEDALIKQRARRNPRNRRGTTTQIRPGAVSVSAEEMNEGPPAAATQEGRKMMMMGGGGPPGSEKMMTTPGAVASSGRSRPTSFASADERQLKYEAKMAQMEQQHENRREGRVTSNDSTYTEPSLDTTSSFRSSSQQATEQSLASNPSVRNSSQRAMDYDSMLQDMEQQRIKDREAKLRASGDSSRSQGPRSSYDAIVRSKMSEDASSRGMQQSDRDRQEKLNALYGPASDSAYGNLVRSKVAEDADWKVNDNELAVAIAIEDDEDDEDKVIAYAIEYDPDSKPPLYKNRRFRIYAIGGALGFVVLVTLLVVIVLIAGKKETLIITEPPTSAPSQSPTTSLESKYLTFFASVLKNDKVLEAGTPHYSAAQWIMKDDPMKLSPSAPNLLQRFMMAFLWFHTTKNGEEKWRSCNPPEEDEDNTCVFDQFTIAGDDTEYYEPLEGRVRWLSGEDECFWVGVQCEGSPTVLGFSLFGQNMTGTLPTELAALDFLQRISLAHNQLTGSIPSIYGNMKYLIDLELHSNQLTSTIPKEFFEGESFLQRLNIGDNVMSGTLDTRVGTMLDLKGLHLFENSFMGEFPTEIGDLDLMAYMRVDANEFSGPIPSQLGSLTQLAELWLMENNFTSTIPSELGQLTRITDLRVSANQLTGTIPEELYTLSRVIFLQLDENRLSGTLSTAVGQLTNMWSLRVNNNELTGTIPAELQYATSLKQIWIMYNLFTGEVPRDICSLYVAPEAGVSGLISLQADCSDSPPPNNCYCCSVCCSRQETICLALYKT